MLSQDFRRKFLQYFKSKGHTIVPSSSVVPHDDPTLLFMNAGMNQFKDVFLGNSKREYTRATSSQKCIRVGGKHNDLDNVGHTSRHLTFFEMLGNFSFGDYFKKEAIAFAWELSQNVFEFDPEKIWISVFETDDEAFELWTSHVPAERIVRMGEKDNFWAMGDTGPCGPCSELYYDRGPSFGDGTSPKNDPGEERYLEFWNLVFMQYNRDRNGKMHPLPKPSIDTGSGLERVVSLKMGVDNVFQTDILRHLIGGVEHVTGKAYNFNDEKLAPAFHVIADHIRSLAFAIADGAQPSNIERGYVLRKLVRRAVRYGRSHLEADQPFLAKVLPFLIETMGPDYREIAEASDRIGEILTLEEEGFLRTLKRGGNILNSVVDKALESPHKQISGEDAFKLKDTYGFPLEEILLIAKDSDLQVNIDAYQLLEEKAKERSRSARTVEGQEASENLFSDFVKKHGPSTFVGYSDVKAKTQVIGIVQDGTFVDSISAGNKGILLLKSTPFYAEKGGQVTDHGMIEGESSLFTVNNCQSPFPDVITHEGILTKGTVRIGDDVVAKIDDTRRDSIAAHHTATHLLHYALQEILGSHIRQAGSLVETDRLRFDFNHHKPLSDEQVIAIEDLVNAKIRENQSVSTYEITFEEAQSRPEVKQFFGDKYGSHVRVVDIQYSKELCGGTHAPQVGNLGYFRILKESSIAAGVRRIEAACGKAAEQFVRDEESRLHEVSGLLKTQPTKLVDRIEQLLEEQAEMKAEIKSLKKGQFKQLTEELVSKFDGSVVAEIVKVEPEDLAELADLVLAQVKTGVVALAVTLPSRVQLIVKLSKDFVEKGLKAGALIKEVAPLIGGGGGGRPDSATAGGKNPDGANAALDKIKHTVQSL